MKQLRFLLAILAIGAMSFIPQKSEAQSVISQSVTYTGIGTIYHFEVVLSAANPNGRGIEASWTFAWRLASMHTTTNGVVTMGPVGGTTYTADVDVASPSNGWKPAGGWAFVPGTTDCTGVSYICDACLQ